jgi:hypothetical protein
MRKYQTRREERQALVQVAMRDYVLLDTDGSILDYIATVADFAEDQNVSLQRARAAITAAAHRLRNGQSQLPDR